MDHSAPYMRCVKADMSEFLWGVAIGANQTEGNNVSSDWWGYEHPRHARSTVGPGGPYHSPRGWITK